MSLYINFSICNLIPILKINIIGVSYGCIIISRNVNLMIQKPVKTNAFIWALAIRDKSDVVIASFVKAMY